MVNYIGCLPSMGKLDNLYLYNIAMVKDKMIFEIAKAIAPIFAQKGVELQQQIANNGRNPIDCKIEDKDIPHAYGEYLKLWATAFVEELNNI